MQFLYPNFLYLLLVITIPIIIHLFNFKRYKKVFFTNVRMLQKIQQKSQSTSKIQDLITLFFRILAITFLVLAFAQPYIPNKNQKINNVQYDALLIYIDNSYSMSSENTQGDLLEQAKNLAYDIVMKSKNISTFFLHTNDAGILFQNALDKAQMLQEIQKVQFSSYSADIENIESRISHIHKTYKLTLNSFIISDFQKNSFQFSQSKSDSIYQWQLIKLSPNEHNNIHIDSIWFSDPYRAINKTDMLYFRLYNSSNEAKENVLVNLLINDEQKGILNISLPPNSFTDTSIYFTVYEPGKYACELNLEDYPITFDNTKYFSFEVTPKIEVLSIYEKIPFEPIEVLFKNEPNISFKRNSASSLDYRILQEQNFIILENILEPSSGLINQLNEFMQNGGSTAVFFNKDINISKYNEWFSILKINEIERLDTVKYKITSINTYSSLFKNVFEKINNNTSYGKTELSIISKPMATSNQEEIIQLENKQSILSLFKIGKGKLYQFKTIPQNSSWSFHKNSLFVPSMLNIANQSIAGLSPYYNIQNNASVFIKPKYLINTNKGNNLRLKLAEKNVEIIPELKVKSSEVSMLLNDQISSNGNYQLVFKDSLLDIISLNLSNLESNIQALDINDLQNYFGNTSVVIESNGKNIAVIQEKLEKTTFWIYCIVLCLIFLLLEIISLRFFRWSKV